MTEEYASRLAVTAVIQDLEYWARHAAVEGYVGLNDLIQTFDMVRLASAPESSNAI
jgi:hypothetical protein